MIRLIPTLCVALLLAAPTPALADSAAELSAFDVLCRAGRTATLRAKMESKGILGINPDVEDETLDFYLLRRDGADLAEPKYLGSGDTNDDGIAELEWEPKDPAQYELEVRVRRGSEYVALPAPIFVAVPPPEKAIVLVHLDGTVSDATNMQLFQGTANDQIPPIEGAQTALAALATHYQLVYLTDLDATFTSVFKSWLELRQIPKAPVFFWDLFSRSLSHETYLRKLVGKLSHDFPRISIGVGGLADDGAAFVEQGLAGVVFNPDEEPLPEVLGADSWEKVVLHVAQLHRTNGLIRDLASLDAAKSDAALAELTLLGADGLGYVTRFRQSTDQNVSAAATLVAARIHASEAFVAALDLTSADQAMAGLLAAWRGGDLGAVVRLYREADVGKREQIPSFRICEMISRSEPEPGKVVYRIRLLGDDEPAEREVVFLEREDKTWRVDVEAF